MIEIKKNNFANFLFLELISFTPLLIILGNVVPPFPLKFHFIAFGISFLLMVWILINNSNKKWILYVTICFTIVQFTFGNFDFKSWVDFFFGPFVLITLFDILINKKFPNNLLKRYERRFYYLLWVPLIFSVLQFFEILPLTFWNATYINSVVGDDGTVYDRSNGFLFHGAELSIIICFVAFFQFFKKETESFWFLFGLIFIAATTYFKAVVACTLLTFFYYLAFVNKGLLSQFRLISTKRIVAYGIVLAGVIGVVGFQYISTIYHYTGYFFPHGILTGRGAIWNIYTDGIKEFSFSNYLFGAGIGSEASIFREFAHLQIWYPYKGETKEIIPLDSHNAILGVFMKTGLIGLCLYIYMFKMVYTQVVQWRPSKKMNQIVFGGFFLILIFTIGFTITIFEMAIFWPSFGFLLYRWKFYSQDLKKNRD